MRAACGSACNGLLFFRPRNVFFQTVRLVYLVSDPSIFFLTPTCGQKNIKVFFWTAVVLPDEKARAVQKKTLDWKKTSRPATQTTLKKSECEATP